MTKEELLVMLRRGLNEEEKAIPLYTKHLGATLFLSGFKPELQVRVKELLLLLKKESESHAKVYGELIASVKEARQDVY
ncbi:MAG: hypothetical protein WC133_05480 [Candidatus Omnitrophota bacterium]